MACRSRFLRKARWWRPGGGKSGVVRLIYYFMLRPDLVLLGGIANNETYLNVHTTIFPGGEIRGILSLETPEPGTFLLAGAMLAGLLVRRRE